MSADIVYNPLPFISKEAAIKFQKELWEAFCDETKSSKPYFHDAMALMFIKKREQFGYFSYYYPTDSYISEMSQDERFLFFLFFIQAFPDIVNSTEIY